MINVSSDRLQILHKKFSQFFNSKGKGMYPDIHKIIQQLVSFSGDSSFPILLTVNYLH